MIDFSNFVTKFPDFETNELQSAKLELEFSKYIVQFNGLPFREQRSKLYHNVVM